MTGQDHLHQQERRVSRFTAYSLLTLMPCWLAILALDSLWLTRAVIGLSLLLLASIVVLFPPRCPTCRKLLALVWKGASIHRYCPHCGMDFARELGATPASTHKGALTIDT